MVAAAAHRLGDDLPVTFLPALPYGKSNEHIASPGTLTLAAESLASGLTDIAESVHRAGVCKLILINSHGGNVPVLDIIARDLRVRHSMLVVAIAWSRFGYPEGIFPVIERTYGIHGGDFATSVMLYLCPELVHMELAADFKSIQTGMIDQHTHRRAHGTHPFAWQAQDLNPEGVVGNASATTAEKGKAVVAHQADGFAALCRDVHEFDLSKLWTAKADPARRSTPSTPLCKMAGRADTHR